MVGAALEPRSSDRDLNLISFMLLKFLLFRFFFIFQLQTANSSLAKDLCSNQQKVCMDFILIRALKDLDVIQINLVTGCQITHADKFPQNLSLISVF